MRAKNDPYYYESIRCSICNQADGEMLQHKFTDQVTCSDCVNKLVDDLFMESVAIDDAKEEANYLIDLAYEMSKDARACGE
jgi:hypothetical protein